MRSQIDILLSTYNGARFLEVQIDSLLAQTYTNWRLLIRDDGSTDETLDILMKYSSLYPDKILFFPNQGINLGSSRSFIYLMNKSTADYVMFCDQDDFWLPDKLDLSYKYLIEQEKYYSQSMPLMVFSDLIVVDSNLTLISNSFIRNQKLFIDATTSPSRALAHNAVAGCTILLNRAALECCCSFPNVNIVHDQWIVVNVAHYGKVFFMNEATILYRQHSNNAVGANNVNFKFMIHRLLYDNKLSTYFKILKSLSFRISKIEYLYFKIYYSLKRIFYIVFDTRCL